MYVCMVPDRINRLPGAHGGQWTPFAVVGDGRPLIETITAASATAWQLT